MKLSKHVEGGTYLQKLHDSNENFDYKIARDTDSGSATMLVWQTETMRADVELYGCAPHLDFMKRKLNSNLWPYISVVAIDANGCPCVVIEGIACMEQKHSHIFAINELLKMAPGRLHNGILAIFVDEMSSPTVLGEDKMNLPNAHFFWDRNHLLNDIWPKQFGGSWSSNLSSMLQTLTNSLSEDSFEQSLTDIQSVAWMMF